MLIISASIAKLTSILVSARTISALTMTSRVRSLWSPYLHESRQDGDLQRQVDDEEREWCMDGEALWK
jgi:hypothetical protein